ncbi:STAS domain-containing protein [Streptomyces sp. NPDC006733]|uniref:STAS domain-containing protein n=1 Tax=Streptomyces sp. NPDC006733 TaxID=3155460 RepID=UPI0033EBC4A8
MSPNPNFPPRIPVAPTPAVTPPAERSARAGCTHERRAGLLIYRLSGDLDLDTAEVLAFDRPLDGVRAVLVDLSGVGFFGATALNALLHLRRKAAARALTVHLAGAHTFSAQVLDLTGAGTVFPRHAGLDSALALLT